MCRAFYHISRSSKTRFTQERLFTPKGHYFAHWCEKRLFLLSVNGAQTRVSRACVKKEYSRQNDDSAKWISAKWCVTKLTFGQIPIRESDIQYYIVSVISLFGNMTIRPTDIRRHDVSGKWRIGEMKFRKKDVAPSNTGIHHLGGTFTSDLTRWRDSASFQPRRVYIVDYWVNVKPRARRIRNDCTQHPTVLI